MFAWYQITLSNEFQYFMMSVLQLQGEGCRASVTHPCPMTYLPEVSSVYGVVWSGCFNLMQYCCGVISLLLYLLLWLRWSAVCVLTHAHTLSYACSLSLPLCLILSLSKVLLPPFYFLLFSFLYFYTSFPPPIIPPSFPVTLSLFLSLSPRHHHSPWHNMTWQAVESPLIILSLSFSYPLCLVLSSLPLTIIWHDRQWRAFWPLSHFRLWVREWQPTQSCTERQQHVRSIPTLRYLPT